MEQLEIVHEGDKFGVATVGPVLIGCWCRQGRVVDLGVFVEYEDRLLARYPDGIRILTILAGQESLGSEDGLRQEGARLARKYADQVQSHATVLRATGLAAVFARSFLTGIQILSRTRYPTKVFAHVAPSLQWLLETPTPLEPYLAAVDALTASVEGMIIHDPDPPAPDADPR